MSYNVTVDDSDANIVYTGLWNVQGCEGCSAVPTAAQMHQVYGETYHDVTVPEGGERATVEFTFDGTAVYVYGWSVNTTTERPHVKNHDMTFKIDLDTVGEYKAAAGPDSTFNVLYFGTSGLQPGSHTLTMVTNPDSISLLDYIVFTESHHEGDSAKDPNDTNRIPFANPSDSESTSDNPDNARSSTHPASNDADRPAKDGTDDSSSAADADSDSHHSNAGSVAAIVVVVLLLAVAAVLFFLWWRRRRQRARTAAMASSRTFIIDDEPGMMYIGAPGMPLSRYGSGSSVPHTPTLQRQFLDPGTPALYDAPEVHVPAPLLLSRRSVPPPLVLARRSVPAPPPQYSPLRIVTPVPTAQELPLPLGPPSEASYLTYPDTIDLPQDRPPVPLPPMPLVPPSPVVASSPTAHAHNRQSVRRLVVYNAPSEVSATDENVGPDRDDQRRLPSPPPPVPTRRY